MAAALGSDTYSCETYVEQPGAARRTLSIKVKANQLMFSQKWKCVFFFFFFFNSLNDVDRNAPCPHNLPACLFEKYIDVSIPAVPLFENV